MGSFGYVVGPDRGDHCLIDVDTIAIPGPDCASVADPLKLLPEGESALFAGTDIIKQKSDWPPRSVLTSTLVYKGVKPNHYPRLIKKLLAAKMVTLNPTGEDIMENSIFGVSKQPGVSQRLIWAGNRSNLFFNESLSGVELPSPDMVSSLFLPDVHQLRIEGCDISQYYNRLRAPPEVIPFLGLPSIKAEAIGLPNPGRVTPCLTCVPIGATFLVALWQAVTVAVLGSSHLPVPKSFGSLADSKLKPGRNVVLPYIDDITIIGTSAAKVNRDRRLAAAALADTKLRTDKKKDVIADDSPFKVAIGLACWSEGVLTVKPAHALRLFWGKSAILRSKRASTAGMQEIIGL